MEKGLDREVYVDYFIERLFYRIQQNPSCKTISFDYVRERANLATDIYLTLVSKNKSTSYSLEKAIYVLYCGFNRPF